MANEVENIVSNMSYTNKDFIAVYTELLDLFRKLTSKYDPSLSNESDPGVILTKLNALIADKLNYNIDKNILETFPVSVTQESNARDLFEQLGYHMKWYRSATTPISLSCNVKDDTAVAYKLPRFTMVSDGESEIVYTTIDGVDIPNDPSKYADVDAMQGIAVEYELNGSKQIKFSSLDSSLRLYFSDPMVAENGIFICGSDVSGKPDGDYSKWVRVDNMSVYPTNTTTHYYEFGVTHDGTPFLQFSEVADRDFGSGIYITYLKTVGLEGNIKRRFLSQFYSTVSATPIYEDPSQTGDAVSLTDENTKITNSFNAVDGADKETIDEAYRNYKKTVGVFETLVSLRDYTDYINSGNVVSNCFVCDMTDDIQDSYRALMEKDGQISYYTYVDEGGSPSEPLMSAFDLKLYCLNYVGTPTNASTYNETFVMMKPTDSALNRVKSYIESVKCIQHDYVDIEANKLCYIINVFDLGIRIVPHSRVTSLQAKGIIDNVVTALSKSFNAKEVSFGDEASYDRIYSTIMGADPLIKTVVLDDIDYVPYAMYYDGTDFQSVRVDGISSIGAIVYVDGSTAYTDSTKSSSVSVAEGELVYDTNSKDVYIGTGNNYVSKSISSSFKFEIYAKSVLNGNSPLFVKDDKFDYSLNQVYDSSIDNIAYITTNTTIPLGTTETALEQNESVVFYVPSYETVEEYSTYVGIETNVDLTAGTVYTLGQNEKVILYWKESDSDANYHYNCLSTGSVVKVSQDISASESLIGADLSVGKGITDNETTSSVYTQLYQKGKTLSGSKSLQVLRRISVSLASGSQLCYWVLNNKTYEEVNGEIVGKYVLFPSGVSEYILQNGEYFFYTNNAKTSLNILYPGTRIVRYGSDSNPFSCDAIDADVLGSLSANASDAPSNIWKPIPSDFSLGLEEMEMYSVGGEGASVKADSSVGNLTNSILEIDGDTKITIKSSDGEEKQIQTYSSDSIYGVSILSYVSSPSSPLVLNNSRQSIVFYGDNGSELGTVSGNSSSPYYILSDDDYSIVGGSNIDVRRTVVSAIGTQVVDMSAYVYTGGKVDGVKNTYPDDLPLNFNSGVNNHEIVFSAPDGEYILPLTNNSGYAFSSVSVYSALKHPITSEEESSHKAVFSCVGIENVVIVDEYSSQVPYSIIQTGTPTSGETVLVTNNGNEFTLTFAADDPYFVANSYLLALLSTEDVFGDGDDFSVEGTHYIRIVTSGDTSALAVMASLNSGVSGTYTLTLGKLYKYTDVGNFADSTTFKSMVDKVTSLDRDKKFCYTYKIPVDSYIGDPLSGDSFVNVNHPYNKFTICEINMGSLNNIKVNTIR